MKTKIILLATIVSFFTSCKPKQKVVFNCSTADGYEKRVEIDPIFKKSENELERNITKYLDNLKKNPSDFQSTTVTIPVVVHVVYKNATENISDAQINSQITALNQIFRRNNADLSSSPSVFTSIAADTNIEFALAKRDPNCNATTGIIRKSTSQPYFYNNYTDSTATVRNPVKFNSSGGDDAWPSDRYLNIWVCDLVSYPSLTDGLIGYAAFPSDISTRPTEDGVVMDFKAFGTIGTVVAPLNLGRVCGHEIGHWLNLRHIWGDDGTPEIPGICDGFDFVSDTPNQGLNNSGCPTFPHITCSNGPNGDMYCNQMDYTNDACRTMYSNGQSDRMAATLYTVRRSITSSLGALPPTGIASPDLFTKDTGNDLGNEPNNESSILYSSDDIWIRNTNNGFSNQEHQNPNGGQLNYVYVKVRNRGCSPSTSANLKLYWGFASSGLSWPAPWDGSITSPALMGNVIGTKPTGIINGNDFQIFEFPWTAPDPSDYSSIVGADIHHFCLLSRIETNSSSPYGMTSPETSNLGLNVKNNNNIAWKNVSVIDTDGPTMFTTSVLLANYTKANEVYKIVIKPLKKNKSEDLSIFINENKTLLGLIREDGIGLNGIENQNGRLLIKGGYGEITGLKLKAGAVLPLSFRVDINKEKIKFKRDIFEFVVEQYTQKGEFVGGELMKVKMNRRM